MKIEQRSARAWLELTAGRLAAADVRDAAEERAPFEADVVQLSLLTKTSIDRTACCGSDLAQQIASSTLPRIIRRPVMTRISSLAIGLVLSFAVSASGEESQPSQTPSQKAQSKEVCRSKCQVQYATYECTEGVAPMHSPCELFNQCLQDCD
jgi:hypothetical protein